MVNILARILDLERNFNGSADPMITMDRDFVQLITFLCPDFGFWLLGSSDSGSRVPPEISLALFYALFLLSLSCFNFIVVLFNFFFLLFAVGISLPFFA